MSPAASTADAVRDDLWKGDQAANAVIEDLFPVLRDLGAEVVDPVEIPDWMEATGEHVGVMFPEFRFRIDRYLADLTDSPVRTLEEVVAFNEAHHDEGLAIHSQNIMEAALGEIPAGRPGVPEVASAVRAARARWDRRNDACPPAGRDPRPTFRRAWQIDLATGDDPENGNGAAGPSNAAGYPHITVPAGFVEGFPIGVSLLASAWEEPKLLGFAYALEQATKARRAPTFREGYNVRAFVPR
jgi:amidase